MESSLNIQNVSVHAMKCYEHARRFEKFKFAAIGFKNNKRFNCGNKLVVVFAVVHHDLDQQCVKNVLTSIATTVRDSFWLYRDKMAHHVSTYNVSGLKYVLAMIVDPRPPHHMRLRYEPIYFIENEEKQRVVYPERAPEIYGFD